MTRKLFVCLPLVAVFFIAGCGNNHQLTGTVTFTDGNPVPRGMVLFTAEGDAFQARGQIRPDGTYIVGALTDRDGLPPGEYRVHVTDITKTSSGTGGVGMPVPLVLERYFSDVTSGLTVTVPAPGNRFDIVLEPHPVNYP